MQTRIDPSSSLVQLAEHQSLVVTTEQALAHGLGFGPIRRLLHTGQWRRLGNGLLYLRPGEPPWTALAWGGVLLGGDWARLGGDAAAYLHHLRNEPPRLIEVRIPWTGASRASFPPWVFRRERPGVRLRSIGDPPRLSVEDAVLDLCAGASEAEIIYLVTRAVQERRTSVQRMRRRLAERSHVPHRKLLLELLGEVRAGADTSMEVRYLRLERRHGLPTGERQARNRAGHIRDVYYALYRLVVELDGVIGHDGMGRFKDMRRDNVATLDGDAVLRYGRSDLLSRPCAVMWQVGAALIARGWAGWPSRCDHCRHVPDRELMG